MSDAVNHPSHYQGEGVECIDAIRAALGPEGFVAYCRGNVLKYAWRAGSKGPAAEDLRKAAWYSARAADALSGQQKAAGCATVADNAKEKGGLG